MKKIKPTKWQIACRNKNVEQSFAWFGYRLVAERQGFRIFNTNANLYGAFWSYPVCLNVLGELLTYGRRRTLGLRTMPEGRTVAP